MLSNGQRERERERECVLFMLSNRERERERECVIHVEREREQERVRARERVLSMLSNGVGVHLKHPSVLHTILSLSVPRWPDGRTDINLALGSGSCSHSREVLFDASKYSKCTYCLWAESWWSAPISIRLCVNDGGVFIVLLLEHLKKKSFVKNVFLLQFIFGSRMLDRRGLCVFTPCVFSTFILSFRWMVQWF